MRSLLLFATAVAVLAFGQAEAQTLAEGFARPPAEARPMVRWWWFGPAFDDKEIVREIRAMKAGGFGGFELQTVYPLSLEGNVPFLSDAHLKAIRLANETARAEGLRVDATLGAGWPFGGPHISADLAATGVKLMQLPVTGQSIDLPPFKPGEHIIATFFGPDMASAKPIEVSGTRVIIPAGQTGTLFVVLQHPTGQQVKRAAVGAEGFVMDHMNPAAVAAHLQAVGDKLLTAFGDHPPFAVFSDSLEAFGSDWTGDLMAEFQKRRGYDLKPHLLELFHDSPESAAVRHDWGQTLVELVGERYLSAVTAWAHRHNTKFRSQTYGFPPVSLASNRLVDLAEGEGPNWRAFSTTRWASSSNHIYGNPVTSAESWTWLHAGAFQATPLDIKAEADTLMLEGVNQFIAHGWPYSPPNASEPGWSLYAAAVFNDHNPWWIVMPDVNRYLQRMSFLLRQGTPVTDVALFLPEDDALAAMRPGAASITEAMKQYVTPALTAQILDAGYNFDYVDGQTVLDKGLSYKVLILPRLSRIAPKILSKIADFVSSGGKVLVLDKMPNSAPGLANAEADGESVRRISRELTEKRVHIVAQDDLGRALQENLPPDVAGAPPLLGFVHRHLPGNDLYFVANTSSQPITAPLKFREQTGSAQWWDARTGERHMWNGEAVSFAPYQSKVFVFGADAPAAVAPSIGKAKSRVLAKGWSIAFGHEPKRPLSALGSWSDSPGHQFYSGVVTYSCNLTLTAAEIGSGLTTLDFGTGVPLDPAKGHQNGTRALLAPPLREAAEVYVNGKRAGAVWTAPFTLSLRGLLHAGKNELEIRGANTAVNVLAGKPPADYSALNAKYGERFQPQNMSGLKPLPSGLLHAPSLTVSP